MVKIRLSRGGKKKQPFYKIVVANSTSPRDGKFIDSVGFYNPMAAENEPKVQFDTEKILKWFSNGAIPTETVARLMSKNESLKDISVGFFSLSKNKSPKKEAKQ